MHNCSAATGSPCTCGRNTQQHTELDALNVEATFASFDDGTIKNPILISDTTEETFFAVAEWAQYFAAFFNKEKEVYALAATTRQRWQQQVDLVPKSEQPPKVLLLDGYYSSSPWYSDGWYLSPCKLAGVCPVSATGSCAVDRWCDLVKGAGGDVLNKNISSFKTAGYTDGTKQGISHAELIAFAKDADVLIMKVGNKPASEMATVLEALKGIKAVDNKAVFDNQRILDDSGGNAIFGYASLEPDVMGRDIIKMLDPSYNHQMVFFRNLFTEGKGNDVKCADVTDAALKAAQVGCIPTAQETAAKCTNHSLTDDVLKYVPGGYGFMPFDSSGVRHSACGYLLAAAAALAVLAC